MVADDISTGSQDEGMTRHHSSSLRGPRPPPSDTPPPSKRLRHPHPPTLPTPCSDRGSQYTSQKFPDHLKGYGIRPSVGRTGRDWMGAWASVVQCHAQE